MREYSPGQNEGDALGYSPYLGDYYRSLADYPNLYQRNYAPARPLGTYLPGYGLDPRTNDSGIRKTSAYAPHKSVMQAMLDRISATSPFTNPTRSFPPDDPRRFSSVPGILGPPSQRRVGGIGSDYARAGGSYPTFYENAATIAANSAALGAESPQVPTARATRGIGSDYAAGGARGRYSDPQVAALQQDLNTLNAGLKVDGIMGPKTRGAMSKYNVVSTPGNRINTAFGAAAQPEVRRPSAGLLSALQSPYATSTGGANAIQTARIPQARPPTPQWALPVQAALPAPVAPLMFHPVQMLRNAAAAAQREAQSRSSQGSSRSGMGYSGGGGYSSGGYNTGSTGGRSIGSGIGGAFRNR
jgi:peptidoglycan hydrolase-like protein with peptidoglycan-binding domain